jgi:two-component system cell cycle sensor histidine kinase/response regulator CckA
MSTEALQVLVVEDDEDDFLHVRQLLKKKVAEAEVERAATAAMAVEMAADHSHDLCFVDYRLGDQDGLQVLRQLKDLDAGTPVIFLTGQGDEEVAVEAMKAGATDYLLKSKLNAESLDAAVRYALNLHGRDEAVLAARRALRASEQRFRALVENSSDGIVLLDAQGTITYASQSVRTMLGYSAIEVVETNAFEYLHPEDQAAARAKFAAILRDPGVPFHQEYRCRAKDGEWRLLEATWTNQLQEPAVGAVVINERDVSARKQAEDELRKLSRAVEQSADLVVMTDPKGRIEYVNPTFERLTGYTQQEAVGKTPRILKSGRQDRAYYERMWAKLLSGQVFRDVLINRKKNGELYWSEKTIAPIVDERGEIRNFISNDRDITEQHMLQEQLLHSQKMDAVGQLAGGVAHDFNNLLMVISSYAELLSESISATNAKAQHQAQEILKAARRASVLTQQLLAFSRKQLMCPRILDLNTVLADFGRMLPRMIGEDIQVIIHGGTSLWKVKADPAQIEQVIMNLAVNARDAMPRGGQLVLETSNERLDEAYAGRHVGVAAGEYVMLTVSDTGCGIPADALPHIFEPFFTTKASGKGTGLGLPTVYGIVKQSGGFVWVYSEVDHGSVFKVYLPRATAVSENGREERPSMPPPRGSETILVVEDEDAVRESTSEYLTSRGYTVLQGRNAGDALQMLEHFAGKVHLLVTDVIMPGMSGAELGKRVRERRPETRVMYISGYTESTVVQHGVAGAGSFLQKPFTLAALAGKVREMLDAATPEEEK